MKEISSNYLEERAEISKSNGSISVRVQAAKYEDRRVDRLLWISTQDVLEWLQAKGHKVLGVEQEGFLRNKKEPQDITWIFNSKKDHSPKKDHSNDTKQLKRATDNDNVKVSNKTKQV